MKIPGCSMKRTVGNFYFCILVFAISRAEAYRFV